MDFDGDGDGDLVLLPQHYSMPRFFYFDRPQQRFVELDYSPLPERIKASYLLFVDLDQDGILDLLAGTLSQKSELIQHPLRLFKAKKSKGRISYLEVKGAFESGAAKGAATLMALDFDLDGRLDLFQGNWLNYQDGQQLPVKDILLQGVKDGFHFRNVSALLRDEYQSVSDSQQSRWGQARPTFGASLCDVDFNGYPDIVTASSSGFANRLWINQSGPQGGRLFKDFGREAGMASDLDGSNLPLGGGNSQFALCADYNSDGLIDMIIGEITHSYDPLGRDRSAILTGSQLTTPPQFLRTEYKFDTEEEQRWNRGDRRAIWFDFNSDGLLDLLVENSGFPPHSRLLLFQQRPDHSFFGYAQDAGVDILNPSGAVVMDVNQDGLLDIIVGQSSIRDARIQPRLYLFENHATSVADLRSLHIKLVGESSNLAGVGASIWLKSNQRIQYRIAHSTHGPLASQSTSTVHFGLAAKERVEYLEVRWPYRSKKKGRREIGGAKRYSLAKLIHTTKAAVWDLTIKESGGVIANKR